MDRDSYKAEVAQTLPPTETLNVDTLEQVLDAAWPSVNKDVGNEDYAELLDDLTAFEIPTTDALRKLISKWRASTLAEEAESVSELRKNPKKSTKVSSRERINAGVFYTHVGLTRGVLEREFPNRWKEYALKKLTVS